MTLKSYLAIAWILLAVKVVCDRVSGKSRGYGFVKYTSEAGASAAIKDMDGQVCENF